jgi:L-ribulokinase
MQKALCPSYRTVAPDPRDGAVYERLFPLYRKLYFAFGRPDSGPAAIGDVLPELRTVAADSHR